MGDNLNIQTVDGAKTLATNDVGGIHYQRFKLVLGADGAADQDVDSGKRPEGESVPVTLADPIPLTTPLSGQRTIVTAGTALQLASTRVVNCPVIIKALPTNVGTMFVGAVSGDVTLDNGLPLSAGDAVVFSFVSDLSNIWIDATSSGDKVAWLLLQV